MDLTPVNKAHIDGLNYESLLRGRRFAPIGDAMFQGETGEYWGVRMAEKKAEHPDPQSVSERIGWE